MPSKADARQTLLIVNDEKGIHESLARELENEPYELLHAYDAREASILLERRDDIALVLSDDTMPGMNGVELLTSYRARRITRVLLTVLPELEKITEALDSGAIHHVISIPWDSDGLRLQLRRLSLALHLH